MILNTRSGWHTVVPTLTLLHAASVLVTVLSDGSDCYDSGQNHGNDSVYMPKNCRPTECMVTSSHEKLVEGLQCSIKNYVNHFPNACNEIKEHSSSQSGQPGEAPAYQKADQATLASISLYMFHCDILKSSSVSLNFTFNFPLCGEGETTRSVMVEFSAGKEDVNKYFAVNPICRVFDFTGSNFSHFTQEDQIHVSFDCIGVGLRDGQHRDYSYFYFLSLTTFPASQVLKYTLVYRDVNSTSLILAAAAWLSTSRVHVIFQPIGGVTTYHVAAECLQNKIKISEVNSSSVEISDIPPECIIVRISVTPLASECKVQGLKCSPAILTVDKTGLRLPEESRQKQGDDWPWLAGIIVGVVIISLIIVAILVALLLHCCKRKPTEDGVSLAQVPHLRVLCIASPSVASQNLHTVLNNLGFHVTDAVQDNIRSIIVMRNSNAILISVHPSLTESNHFAAVMELMKQIFSNQQLWEKVRVVSYSSRGQRHLRPSDIFQGTLNNPKEADFLQLLDQRTFNLPEDREELLEDLRCVEVPPIEPGVNRRTEGLDGRGVLSHQNGGVNGIMPDRALGHVEVLSQQNGSGVHGHFARSGSHPAARRQYPAHCQEEAEGLISGGQDGNVVWVPHHPEQQVLFQPENHTRGVIRHVRMCPEVLYHHRQGGEPPECADEDPPSLVDPGNVGLCQGICLHREAELPVGDHSTYPVSQPAPADPMHVRAYQGVLFHRVQGAELPAHAEEYHRVYPVAADEDPPVPVDPRCARTCQGALYHCPQEAELPVQAVEDHPAYPCGDDSDDDDLAGPVWKLA